MQMGIYSSLGRAVAEAKAGEQSEAGQVRNLSKRQRELRAAAATRQEGGCQGDAQQRASQRAEAAARQCELGAADASEHGAARQQTDRIHAAARGAETPKQRAK